MKKTSSKENLIIIGAIVVIFLLVTIATLLPRSSISSDTPVNIAHTDTKVNVSVLIDFGDGTFSWVDLTLNGEKDAFNATKTAADYLGFELKYQEWQGIGKSITEIEGRVGKWPEEYWHLWLWNSSLNSWELSMVGWSSLLLKDGDIIANSYAKDFSDFSSPKPIPTPEFRYPSANFRYDLYNSGNSPSVAPNKSTVIWSYNTSSFEISATPSVAQGKIFVNTWTGFIALNELDGTLLWKNDNIKGMSTPAIFNGNILVGSTDGKLNYLNGSNGNEIWSILLQPNTVYSGLTSSPKVYNNKVFIGTFNESGGNGTFYSIYIENKTIAWCCPISSTHFSSAAISQGYVFIGLAGTFNSSTFHYEPPFGLLSLNEKNGTLKWFFETNGSVCSSPAISENYIYFTSKNGYLYKVDMNGNELWKRYIGISVSSPSINADKIYVGVGSFGPEGKVYAFDKNGEKLWEFTSNGGVQSSVTHADGKIYFTTNNANGTIYCLNSTNGNLLWRYTPQPIDYILSSPVVADGILFVASDNGYVYAFKDLETATTHLQPEQFPIRLLSVLIIVIIIVIIIIIASSIKLKKVAKNQKKGKEFEKRQR